MRILCSLLLLIVGMGCADELPDGLVLPGVRKWVPAVEVLNEFKSLIRGAREGGVSPFVLNAKGQIAGEAWGRGRSGAIVLYDGKWDHIAGGPVDLPGRPVLKLDDRVANCLDMNDQGAIICTMALSGGVYVDGRPMFFGERCDVYLWTGEDLRQLTKTPELDEGEVHLNNNGQAVWLANRGGSRGSYLGTWDGKTVASYAQAAWNYKLARIGDGGYVAFVIFPKTEGPPSHAIWQTPQHVMLWDGKRANDISEEAQPVRELAVNALGHMVWIVTGVGNRHRAYFWNGTNRIQLPCAGQEEALQMHSVCINDNDQIAWVETSTRRDLPNSVVLWNKGTLLPIWSSADRHGLESLRIDNAGHCAWLMRLRDKGGTVRSETYLMASHGSQVFLLGRCLHMDGFDLRNGWLAWAGKLPKGQYAWALRRTRFPE